MNRHANSLASRPSDLRRPATQAMLRYRWPGNVRELIATMRRAVVLANGPLIDVSDLRLEPKPRALPALDRDQLTAHAAAGAGDDRGPPSEFGHVYLLSRHCLVC
jgi:DNA-binding NtrC family response regulator